MYDVLDKYQLYSEAEVDQSISIIADLLNQEYRGQKVIVCPVMTGAIVFAGKLIPKLCFELQVQPVYVSRYTGAGGGIVRQSNVMPDVKGQRVLLLDEILDEGITLDFIRSALSGATDVRIAVLVEKILSKKKPCRPDYCGLQVDEGDFVIGSGMDYNGWGRNLPGIWRVSC